MNLTLYRAGSSKDSTSGVLYLDNVPQCCVIEDEKRTAKVYGETRIPAGIYKVTLRTEGGFHGKYQAKFPGIHVGMLWLRDVPGFEHILMHVGNTDDDTAGCLLLNAWFTIENGEFVGRGSTDAYIALYRKVAPRIAAGEQCWITVED